MAGKKRPRQSIEDSTSAECPFKIRYHDTKTQTQKKTKKTKSGVADDDANNGASKQLSPFAPTGKFHTHETLDRYYVVQPQKKWAEMTRYSSFIMNQTKYFCGNYAFVTSQQSVKRQKESETEAPDQPTHSVDDWVAHILEIRASDEHHVYARVYWMYWPDELPPKTIDGKKRIKGRQPYHGNHELIASNHMDIINVISVTQLATVNQVTDENDEQIQSNLYWRQALDDRTGELSSVDGVCRCNEPGNPDKVLIGCPQEPCKAWLHEECLKHEILMKVWEELGPSKPKIASGVHNSAKKGDRPLSPDEPSSADVAVEQPIEVNTESQGKTVEVSSVKKEARGGSARRGTKEASVPSTPVPVSRKSGAGRPRKNATEHDQNLKPYEGFFDATFKPEDDLIEITDLRNGVEGGLKTWNLEVNCLICGSRIC